MSVADETRAFLLAIDALTDPIMRVVLGDLARALPSLAADASAAAMRLAALAPGALAAFVARESRVLAAAFGGVVGNAAAMVLPLLMQAQGAAVGAGLDAAHRLVMLAAPLGVAWQPVAVADVRAQLAAVQGKTLPALVRALVRDTVTRTRTALAAALRSDQPALSAARVLETASEQAATRLETIAATETMRAGRTAMTAAYAANRDAVPRFVRRSRRDGRVCILCVSLDGKAQDSDAVMASHPRCRCVATPQLLAAGVDGEAWFSEQPENIQRAVLGPGALAKYRDGAPLAAFMKIEETKWGPVVTRRRLSEVR